MAMNVEIFMKKEVYRIIGAAIEVHKTLGPGFLEAVYHEAFEIELKAAGIPWNSQVLLQIDYKGSPLKKEYVADLVCFDGIIVEIKALDKLINGERAQIINYLKATGIKVGLLVNFGSAGKLEWEKFVL
ncbi:MAG: GxxExxY protein [Nitrospirota bacterium]|nr:GxxExxY protein [Nitrospirota bacterium]